MLVYGVYKMPIGNSGKFLLYIQTCFLLIINKLEKNKNKKGEIPSDSCITFCPYPFIFLPLLISYHFTSQYYWQSLLKL